MDYSSIGSACEGNLYNVFATSMDKMRERKVTLELLNNNNHTWNLEVVDFHNYLGVNIDRKENKKKGIKEFAPFMMDIPNMTMFTSANPLTAIQHLIKSRGSG